jgi:hypothetical protein
MAPFGQFSAHPIDRLPNLSLNERSDGRGTIRFEDAPAVNWGRRNSFSGMTPALDRAQFLAIADARTVFDKIQRLTMARPEQA